MFNDDAFSKIKKGARIVNVARGGVIDDDALARALESGQVAQVQRHCLITFTRTAWMTNANVLLLSCPYSQEPRQL